MYEFKATDGRLVYAMEPGERLFYCNKCGKGLIDTDQGAHDSGWKIRKTLLGGEWNACPECWETKKIRFRKHYK